MTGANTASDGADRLFRRLRQPRFGRTIGGMEGVSEELDICADCGAPVSAAERPYAFGQDALLCMGCALRRGGAYDEIDDRWAVAPKIDDLLQRIDTRAY